MAPCLFVSSKYSSCMRYEAWSKNAFWENSAKERFIINCSVVCHQPSISTIRCLLSLLIVSYDVCSFVSSFIQRKQRSLWGKERFMRITFKSFEKASTKSMFSFLRFLITPTRNLHRTSFSVFVCLYVCFGSDAIRKDHSSSYCPHVRKKQEVLSTAWTSCW